MYRRNFPELIFIVALFLFAVPAIPAEDIKGERTVYQNILKAIRKDIEENYYDPKFHGLDLDVSSKKASEFIDQAKSVEEMSDVVARFLYQFDDSHLFFAPPRTDTKVDYGWEIQMIGDKAYVTAVKVDSDAWAKGIRPGDRLYVLEGFIPTRTEFWILKKHYEFLSPQPSLIAVITKPDNKSYKVTIQAKVEKDIFKPSMRDLNLEYENWYSRETHQRFYNKIPELCIWKMPSFNVGEIKLDKMADKLANCSSLILDLRGNSGGLLEALAQLTANFFDHDVMIGTAKRRSGDKKMVVEFHGQKPYGGKLAILVDNGSASAAELFARIVQLEKRGTIVGDRSQGAVMLGEYLSHSYGLMNVIPYGVSVTIADIVMKDGQRLEKVGVEPDEMVLPTPADLLNKRDPALARAASILGFELTPEAAGQIFPKKKNDQVP